VKAAAVAIATAGVVLAMGTLVLARQSVGSSFAERSTVGGVVLVLAGCSAIGVGVVAWRRPSERRYGCLLAAAGFAWFLAEWNTPRAGSALVFTLGVLLFAACAPLVAHAALAYPGGRLTSRVDAAALAAAYAGAVLVLGVLPALAFEPAGQSCSVCPTNLVAVTDDAGIVAWWTRAGARLGIVWALGLVALIAWRLGRSSPAARRARAPVLVPGVAYLALVAAGYVHDVSRDTFAIDGLDRRLRVAAGVALAGVALGTAWAWVRARRARRAVGALVVELGRTPAPGGLRDALARTLGDDRLALVYAVDGEHHVDATGRAVELVVDADRAVTPIVRDGRPAALLVHRADLLDDPDLVERVTSWAGLAIDSERLQAEARAQLADLRASRTRIVAAGDRERRRLERDLHDGAQQRLVGLALGLRMARSRLGPDAAAPVAAGLDEAEVELRGALADLRRLAEGIHPAVLTDDGLGAALEALAEGADSVLDVVAVPDACAPAPIEQAAYLLVAEALRGGPVRATARHAGGLYVVDLDASRCPERLVDLEDRVGALDGRLTVVPGDDGTCHIRAEIPCA
jgi:signal transduction histidine kinase